MNTVHMQQSIATNGTITVVSIVSKGHMIHQIIYIERAIVPITF